MLLQPRLFGHARPVWPYETDTLSPQHSGLVAWWSFSPASGLTVHDLINGADGTITTNMIGGPDAESFWVYDSDRQGYVGEFDGTATYLDLSTFEDDLTGDFTFSFWWQSTATVDHRFLVTIDGFDESIVAETWNNGQSLRANVGNVGSASTLVVNDGAWHHVAFMLGFDGSGQRTQIYVDGIGASPSGFLATSYTTTNLQIGV